MTSDTAKNPIAAATRLFRQAGGTLRTRDALSLGIHQRTLYALRDTGVIKRLGRGLYRLTDLPPLDNPDLLPIAHKIPNAVICLISALAFHELTTQIPHAVYIALKRGTEPPRLEHPPLRIFWFTGKAYSEGIEDHKIDGSVIHVYDQEKTLADCFKYRNKIGMDTVLEALNLYREKKGFDPVKLLQYAQICRVEKVIQPYLLTGSSTALYGSNIFRQLGEQ